MKSQRAFFNPFGKSKVVITVRNCNPIIAQLVRRRCKSGCGLKIYDAIADLEFTSAEIYARFLSEDVNALYIFYQNGTGDLIDSQARQSRFDWH